MGFRPSKCYKWYRQTLLVISNVMFVFCDRYARGSRVPPRVRTALQRDLLAVWAGPDNADSGRLPSAPVIVRPATPPLHQHLGPQHCHTHRQGRGEACHVQGITPLAVPHKVVDCPVLKIKPPTTKRFIHKRNLGENSNTFHPVFIWY